jgi:hypothetical protein
MLELKGVCDAKSGYIGTFGGRKVYPQHPTPDQIDIFDIAQGLSNSCRWGGQIRYFYSIAQHSVFVSSICHPENKLCALLHDASEAYLGDMVKPLKYLPEMEPFRKFEKMLSGAIATYVGINTLEKNEEVDDADQVMMSLEALRLRGVKPTWAQVILKERTPNLLMDNIKWDYNSGFLGEFWTPEKAFGIFLKMYFDLKDEMNVKSQKAG